MPMARSQDWEATLLGLVRKQCYFLFTGLHAVTQLSAWTRCAEFTNLPLRPRSDSIHRPGVLDVLEDSVITQLCRQFMLQNCPSHPQQGIEPPDAGQHHMCESEME